MPFEYDSITNLIPDLEDGDAAAWEKLVDVFEPGLNAMATAILRGKSLGMNAEDLVTTTFSKAWANHEGLRAKSTSQIASWLTTILRRTYVDEFRKRRPDRLGTDAAVGHSVTPSQIVSSQERNAALQTVIAQMGVDNPAQRDVVLLKYYHGLKNREIGEKLGITTGAVSGHIRRANSTLLRLLQLNEE